MTLVHKLEARRAAAADALSELVRVHALLCAKLGGDSTIGFG